MQDYICLVEIVREDGRERWLPGAVISLSDESARVHLAKGNVEPIGKTVPPAPIPSVVVHEPEVAPAAPTQPVPVAEEPAQKKAKGE